ncbi:uncharacterized protein LOC129588360 [Paramacrobiotus metropolitanus]|uniref:uncharacterized protein LOC129588360 n=1 Tax=Paramacrobiotus metropolitanus TaxID=2943436 RepID=UPI002445A645|nr:uncharacterized protein LOC129588360 [Paramacrobiotus metropolitanus]
MVSLRPYANKRNNEKREFYSTYEQNLPSGKKRDHTGNAGATARMRTPTFAQGEEDFVGSKRKPFSPVARKEKRQKKRTEEQTALLGQLRRQWRTRSADVVELFPGSGHYLPAARFQNFKVNLTPARVLMDAVNLALLFFGSEDNALRLFTGDRFGLKGAFGNDLLRDVLGYINQYHPGILAKRAMPIKEIELLQAFSRKLYYYRRNHSKPDQSGYAADLD